MFIKQFFFFFDANFLIKNKINVIINPYFAWD